MRCGGRCLLETRGQATWSLSRGCKRKSDGGEREQSGGGRKITTDANLVINPFYILSKAGVAFALNASVFLLIGKVPL
jgi:hypothetical protein